MERGLANTLFDSALLLSPLRADLSDASYDGVAATSYDCLIILGSILMSVSRLAFIKSTFWLDGCNMLFESEVCAARSFFSVYAAFFV